VIEVIFNKRNHSCNSVWALEQLQRSFDEQGTFELWLKAGHGPMISMLRNGPNAFLMYLRADGDSGFTSRNAKEKLGTAPFRLSNGQDDQYPLSWCLDTDECYKALIEFFSQNGEKPKCIEWHED
jgi:hypothetical protein